MPRAISLYATHSLSLIKIIFNFKNYIIEKMSQIKIIKQDVINSLKHNLNENNIDDLIQELKEKSALEIDIQVLKKGYMW
jgi:hypothetical protein